VIGGQLCPGLDNVFRGGGELLIEVTNILVVLKLIVAGGDDDSLGSLLRPPLVTYGAPFCALVCCLGWCP
jgi:hypothetical protein